MKAHLQHLSGCITNGDFVLMQQPICALDLSTPLGTEILVRISPPLNPLHNLTAHNWIHLAEQNHLLEELTLKIIQKLDTHAKALDPSQAPYYINLSPPMLNHAFVDQFCEMIDKSSFSFQNIGIELTERQDIVNLFEFQQCMQQLKDLGVTFALDDFGQGFSTLSFLKNVHVDCVKIGQQLLQDAQSNETSFILLKSLLSFAREFNVVVIAEGVETKADYQFSCQLQCDGIQGYFYAKPKLLIGTPFIMPTTLTDLKN